MLQFLHPRLCTTSISKPKVEGGLRHLMLDNAEGPFFFGLLSLKDPGHINYLKNRRIPNLVTL